MDHFLDQPCHMCKSRKWCGRQCVHAPKKAPPPRLADRLVARIQTREDRPNSQPKSRIGIRIDTDVLTAIKAGGPGWQSRINEILRAAVLPS